MPSASRSFGFSPARRTSSTRAGKVSIRQLGAQNFIAHNIPSPQRQKVIQTFKRHKTPLQMGVELPSLEAIKRFVQMGNGVALVPGLTVRPELESGALVRVQVPELQIERKLRLVYRMKGFRWCLSRSFVGTASSTTGRSMESRIQRRMRFVCSRASATV